MVWSPAPPSSSTCSRSLRSRSSMAPKPLISSPGPLTPLPRQTPTPNPLTTSLTAKHSLSPTHSHSVMANQAQPLIHTTSSSPSMAPMTILKSLGSLPPALWRKPAPWAIAAASRSVISIRAIARRQAKQPTRSRHYALMAAPASTSHLSSTAPSKPVSPSAPWPVPPTQARSIGTTACWKPSWIS